MRGQWSLLMERDRDDELISGSLGAVQGDENAQVPKAGYKSRLGAQFVARLQIGRSAAAYELANL